MREKNCDKIYRFLNAQEYLEVGIPLLSRWLKLLEKSPRLSEFTDISVEFEGVAFDEAPDEIIITLVAPSGGKGGIQIWGSRVDVWCQDQPGAYYDDTTHNTDNNPYANIFFQDAVDVFLELMLEEEPHSCCYDIWITLHEKVKNENTKIQ